MVDPDGVARGGVRFNKYGYDLNRNWDAPDPKLMPEIWAQRKAVLDWVDQGRRIDLFLSMHNNETIDYIATPLEAGGPWVELMADANPRLSRSSTVRRLAEVRRGAGADPT